MASIDFLHDEAIVDAVCDQVKAHLPSAWVSGGSPAFKCEILAFGDLNFWQPPPGVTLTSKCPMILVRQAGNSWTGLGDGSALGGLMGIEYDLSLLHLWTVPDQCRDATTPRKYIEVARAQAQRAKTINAALFAHRDLGAPTLTTADSGATGRVIRMEYTGTNFLPDLAGLPEGEFAGLEISFKVWSAHVAS